MKTPIMVLLSVLFLAGVVVEARSQPQVKFDATDDERPRPEQLNYPSKGKSSPLTLQGNKITKRPQVKFDATDDEKPRPLYVPRNSGKFKQKK